MTNPNTFKFNFISIEANSNLSFIGFACSWKLEEKLWTRKGEFEGSYSSHF